MRLNLGRPLTITENNQEARFQNDIHLLRPDRELSLEAGEGCRVLAANLFLAPLREYALKLTAEEEPIYFCSRLLNPGGADPLSSSCGTFLY